MYFRHKIQHIVICLHANILFVSLLTWPSSQSQDSGKTSKKKSTFSNKRHFSDKKLDQKAKAISHKLMRTS